MDVPEITTKTVSKIRSQIDSHPMATSASHVLALRVIRNLHGGTNRHKEAMRFTLTTLQRIADGESRDRYRSKIRLIQLDYRNSVSQARDFAQSKDERAQHIKIHTATYRVQCAYAEASITQTEEMASNIVRIVTMSGILNPSN